MCSHKSNPLLRIFHKGLVMAKSNSLESKKWVSHYRAWMRLCILSKAILSTLKEIAKKSRISRIILKRWTMLTKWEREKNFLKRMNLMIKKERRLRYLKNWRSYIKMWETAWINKGRANKGRASWAKTTLWTKWLLLFPWTQRIKVRKWINPNNT